MQDWLVTGACERSITQNAVKSKIKERDKTHISIMSSSVSPHVIYKFRNHIGNVKRGQDEHDLPPPTHTNKSGHQICHSRYIVL